MSEDVKGVARDPHVMNMAFDASRTFWGLWVYDILNNEHHYAVRLV